ncbi:MAG TPA: single-stranded-DNA-specific exonuclease RecJ, partial [Candidatus Omnitrophica bacterium]|nr:single-stranded-DNA-specific exonuclease RecJ [Candidatus Omnitrophota bacterium]
MRKRWKIKQVDEELKERLSRSLGLHPAVSRVLVARGIRCEDEARRFLEADLSYLHSPSKLKGIDKAVKRIKKALDKREKILIYGDYDVDGITGVSLLYTILNKFTDNLTCY